MRRPDSPPDADPDSPDATDLLSVPGFADWDRRHAETRRPTRDGSAVTVDGPRDDYRARHCRCSGA